VAAKARQDCSSWRTDVQLRLIILVLGLAALLLAQTLVCSIRGRVDDESEAGLPAFILITPKESSTPVHRGKAGQDGRLCIPHLSPGTYTVKVWLNGLRAARVRDVVVRNGTETNVGDIRLQLGDCDAPGVMCDSMIPEPTSGVRGNLTVPLGCGVDLDRVAVICAERAPPRSKTTATKIDVLFMGGEHGALMLIPANGARIRPNCRTLIYTDEAFRVDGLGPGDDLCVRTKKGRSSHLFFNGDDVQSTSSELVLSIVTKTN
jgi:hypothetical protein